MTPARRGTGNGGRWLPAAASRVRWRAASRAGKQAVEGIERVAKLPPLDLAIDRQRGIQCLRAARTAAAPGIRDRCQPTGIGEAKIASDRGRISARPRRIE